jgi:hypothetical protein
MVPIKTGAAIIVPEINPIWTVPIGVKVKTTSSATRIEVNVSVNVLLSLAGIEPS